LSSHVYMSKCCLLLLGLYAQRESLFVEKQHKQRQQNSVDQFFVLLDSVLIPLAMNQQYTANDGELTFLHDQDELLVRIASIHSLALMANHRSAAAWMIQEKNVISTVILTGVCHNNLYVRHAAADLFVRLVYLNHSCLLLSSEATVDGQEAEEHAILKDEVVRRELIDRLYSEHKVEFFDFVLTLMQYAFERRRVRDDDLLHVQLNRLSLENDDRMTVAQVLQNFIIQHRLMDRVLETMRGSLTNHEELSKAGDVLIFLSGSRLLSGESAMSLLGTDSSFVLSSFLNSLLSFDEYTVDLACRVISSLDPRVWRVSEQQQNRNYALIQVLFEDIQALLIISIVDIKDNDFVESLKSLNSRKKLKLINLLLKSLCDLIIDTKAAAHCSHIYHFLMAVLQEYEPLHSSVSVVVYRLLMHFLNIREYVVDAQNSHLKQLKEHMFTRFSSSNHATTFTLIGQCLPLMCHNDIEQYCTVLTERLFDYSWEIRDSCLCILDHLIQTRNSHNQIEKIVQILLTSKWHNQYIQDIVVKKLSDSQQFVRLSAMTLLRTMLHNNLYTGDKMVAFTTSAQIIVDSEFSIRKSILKAFEHWSRDGILPSLDNLLSHQMFVTHMKAGVSKIFNEFDFESMYYVLVFAHQLCESNQTSSSSLIELIITTNIYDILYECVSNCSVDRTQKLAISISETLMDLYRERGAIPSQFLDKLNQLITETTTVVTQEVQENQLQGTSQLMDIVDFFKFDQESYDCY